MSLTHSSSDIQLHIESICLNETDTQISNGQDNASTKKRPPTSPLESGNKSRNVNKSPTKALFTLESDRRPGSSTPRTDTNQVPDSLYSPRRDRELLNATIDFGAATYKWKPAGDLERTTVPSPAKKEFRDLLRAKQGVIRIHMHCQDLERYLREGKHPKGLTIKIPCLALKKTDVLNAQWNSILENSTSQDCW